MSTMDMHSCCRTLHNPPGPACCTQQEAWAACCGVWHRCSTTGLGLGCLHPDGCLGWAGGSQRMLWFQRSGLSCFFRDGGAECGAALLSVARQRFSL